MASSLTISSILMFFFLSSPFFPAARGGDGLLETACTVDTAVLIGIPWDYNLCIKVLQSIPHVASSPDLPTLVVNIIITAISNVSNTKMYIQDKLNGGNLKPPVMNALKTCGDSYALAVGDFKGALANIVENKDYRAASFGLYFVRAEDIDSCNKALASNKVEDQDISSGNKFAFLFSASADAVCSRFEKVQ